MKRRVTKFFLAAVVLAVPAGFGVAAAQEKAAQPPGWLERDRATGDWGGGRTWLEEHGITLKPRFTQFYQGMTSGGGDQGFEYGAKADVTLDADLDKLGLWRGLSFTIHAEYNVGNDVNSRGGTLMPVNTALQFPGLDSTDAFDFSGVTLKQAFGAASVMLGKVSIIDYCDKKPFMGGVGITSFWNIVFAAPPSGTVPAYFFGALLSVRTDAATYGLWVYDPNSSVNKAGLDSAFTNGVTIRGSVSLPVTIAGLSGHQGLAASYSNKPGTNLETLDDIPIPPPSDPTSIKDNRYYAAHTFDQYLYQSKANPKEGVGLFGQFAVSDGNPNPLYWMAFGGMGGTGLIPGRSRDNWGVGYYYAAPSRYLEDVPAPYPSVQDEQACEVFYNFALTPWLVLGADVQVVRPSMASGTAVFSGLRAVIPL